MFTALNKLRDDNPALRYGTSEILELNEPQKTFGIVRRVGENEVLAIFNFSADEVVVNEGLLTGEYTRFDNGEKQNIDTQISLPRYSAMIFYK